MLEIYFWKASVLCLDHLLTNVNWDTVGLRDVRRKDENQLVLKAEMLFVGKVNRSNLQKNYCFCLFFQEIIYNLP